MAAVAPSAKRKRGSQDIPNVRPSPGMNQDFTQSYHMGGDDNDLENADNTFDLMLAQHNAASGAGGDNVDDHSHDNTHHQHHVPIPGSSASDTAAAAMAQYHTMTVPQSTEQAFMRDVADATHDRSGNSMDVGGSGSLQRTSSFADLDGSGPKDGQDQSNGDLSPAAIPSFYGKPPVGSDEWHKIRKDNHKEVERRRRETINEGINELAKIVPGCEKNKGSILARAVQFITQLKDNESQNIEKWTLEKLLTEQAIAELSTSCDKLKADYQRAMNECEQWKRAAQKAGASIDSLNKLDGDVDGGAD